MDFQKLQSDWERKALFELYREYKEILRVRKLSVTPAILEIFDSEVYWGQWHSSTRTLRLSRKLLLSQPWHHVLGVLKHEMAHQIVDEFYRASDLHGEIFQKACHLVGVPRFFSRAAVNFQNQSLEWRDEKRDALTEARMEKVRRLLSLAGSANEHEALLAMKKVRELYALYNLETLGVDQNPDFSHVVIKSGTKRIESFEKKIMNILIEHFFVQALIGTSFDVGSGEYFRTIEIVGTRENVLMAEYVFYFLTNHSHLLSSQKKLSRLERRSFRMGILEGFEENLKGVVDKAVEKALVVFKQDPQLDEYMRFVYPRIRTVRSKAPLIEADFFSAGKKEGQKLILNKPIVSQSMSFGKLLK